MPSPGVAPVERVGPMEPIDRVRALFSPGAPVVAGLVFCVLLALWMRVAAFYAAGGAMPDYQAWANQYYFGGISGAYRAGADMIAHGKPWGLSSYPPGFPALLAAFVAAGVDNDQALRLGLGALDSLGVLAAFAFARAMRCRWPFALAAAAGYALLRDVASAATFPLAEAVLPMLLTTAFAGMAIAARSPALWRWALAALPAGLAATCRPEIILFIGPLLCWWLIAHPRAARWRTLAVTAAAFAAPLATASAYVAVSASDARVVSKSTWYALYAGLGTLPNDHGYVLSDAYAATEILAPRGITQHTNESEAVFREIYLNAWEEHPGYVLRTITARVARIPFSRATNFVSGDVVGAWSDLIVGWGFWSVLGVGAVLLALRRWRGAALVLLPSTYACANLGWMYHEPRYTIYSHTGSIVALAVGCSLLWEFAARAVRTAGLPPHARPYRFARRALAAAVLAGAAGAALYDAVPITRRLINEMYLKDFMVLAGALAGDPARAGGAGVILEATLDPQAVQSASEVPLDRRPEGTVGVVAAPRYQYQAKAMLAVPYGAEALTIHAAPAPHNGPWMLGVLSEDQGRWISQKGVTAADGGSQTLVLEPGQRAAWLLWVGGPSPPDADPHRYDVLPGSVRFVWGWLGAAPPPPRAAVPTEGVLAAAVLAPRDLIAANADAVLTDLPNGGRRLAASPRAEYQAVATVDAPPAADLLDVTLAPDAHGGDWILGVLKKDGSRWLAQTPVRRDAPTTLRVELRRQTSAVVVLVGGGDTTGGERNTLDLGPDALSLSWLWQGKPPKSWTPPPARATPTVP